MAAYTIEVEQAEDGGWSGMIDALPGLLLMGDTLDELIATAPGAIAFYLDDSSEQAPQRAARVRSFDLEIAA